MSRVLSLYGQPSNILVHYNGIGPGTIGSMDLVIVYQDRNTILFYDWDIKQVGDTLVAYDGSQSHPSIMVLDLIGDGNYSWTPEAIADSVIPYNTKPKLTPLQDLSNMSVEQFFQTFVDPTTSQTIIIPISAIQ